MKFDSFEKLKSLSSNPEETDLTDKEISKDLSIDDNENNQNVLLESVANDDVDPDPDELREELEKVFDKKEAEIPYGYDKIFLTKTGMKDKSGVVGSETNATKHSGKRSNKNKIRKTGYGKIRKAFKKSA